MDKKNFKELYSKLADISDVSLDIWNSEDFIELVKKGTGRSETEIWEAVTKMQLGQEKFSNLLEGAEAHDVNEEMVSTVIHDTVDMRLKPYHGAERHAMLIELLRAGSKMLDKELKESDFIKLSRLSTEKLEHHLETNMQNILEKLLLESLDKACESFQKDDFEPSDIGNISQGALAGTLYMVYDFVQKMPECVGYIVEMGRQIVSLGEKILDNLEFVALWVICLACEIIIGCLMVSALAFAWETFGYAVASLFEIPWAKVVESFVFFMTIFSKELKIVLGIGVGSAVFMGVVKLIKSLFIKNEEEKTVVKDEHISIKDEEDEEDEDTLLDILKKGMENQVTDQKELNETEVENKDEDDDVFEYEDDEEHEDDFF